MSDRRFSEPTQSAHPQPPQAIIGTPALTFVDQLASRYMFALLDLRQTILPTVIFLTPLSSADVLVSLVLVPTPVPSHLRPPFLTMKSDRRWHWTHRWSRP